MKQHLQNLIEGVSGVRIQRIGAGATLAVGHGFSPHSLSNYVYSRDLAELLDRYHIDLVIDVGANEGQFGRTLRGLIGYTGRILSFEPVATAFGELQQACGLDPAWEAFPIALGAERGCLPIHIGNSTLFSSFLQSNPYLRERFGEGTEGREQQTAEVHRLDAFLQTLDLDLNQARMLLKMDTQGFDLQVFAGAAGVLSRVVALQSELSAIPIYRGMPPLTQSLATFEKEGFQVSGLYPLARDEEACRTIEYDCLMLNRAFLPAR
jgi:FkbM family methyltransferase